MAFCVYPVALAIRATNVYEERSLGITHDDEHSPQDGLFNLRRETGYSKFHLREQLAVSDSAYRPGYDIAGDNSLTVPTALLQLKYDVWYILLAYWLSKFMQM